LTTQIEDINKSISSNDKFLSRKENSILSLEEKIKKIKLGSINPAVLILLIRNHIFELEKKRDEILNVKRNNIFELEKLTMDIDNLNNKYKDNEIIVKILREKIENLENEIIKHEKELKEINIESNKNKLINKKNKKLRRSAINKAKTKNEIKKIKKSMMPNLNELNIKNTNFINKTNLLMESKKNKSKIIEELKNKKENKLKSENSIKTKIESINNAENELNNSEKNLDEIDNDISFFKNTSFNEDMLNSINNKSFINKKLKKNKNLGEFKRKFSTQRKINNLSSYYESPLYYNLKEIIDNSPVNEETQKLIEEYLLSQNKLFFDEKFHRDLNINYNRISSEITSLIQKYFKDINMMIYNYKENLKIKTEKGNNGKINSEKIEAKIILNLSNEKIYSLLLGRFLRIISFNYYSDKNNCTILAKDLGQSLL
jgi:hypothetical protein